jgi:two-component system, chemotaxis family, protein-glutamate methylesterase/glutaminase
MKKIRVLVVDDSLFMRTLITDLFKPHPTIEVVGTAKSGPEAIQKLPRLKPDVVTLDLVMPDWDGLTTLRHVMAQHPTPVVILSAYSREGADVTIQCLAKGAVGFVLKPSGEISLNLDKIRHQLFEEVEAAAQVSTERLKPIKVMPHKRSERKKVTLMSLIVIGASTGGAQAVEAILASLPPDFPVPVLVAQHMPSSFFTKSMAERLDNVCALSVIMAQDGDIFRSGNAYLAPGGFRTTAVRVVTNPEAKYDAAGHEKAGRPHHVDIAIDVRPEREQILSPSIDEAMQSVAQIYKEGAVGMILSGIGRDGVRGMQAIQAHGGTTIAQDESALIFGMPKAVIDAGASDVTLPGNRIADYLMEWVLLKKPSIGSVL